MIYGCFEFQMFISDRDCFSSWSFSDSCSCQQCKYRAAHSYSLLPQVQLALTPTSEKCVSGSEAAFKIMIFRRKIQFFYDNEEIIDA